MPPMSNKVNELAFLSNSALKLVIQALRFYLKLICECELHISPKTKVNTAKDHRENYMKVRPPFVHHFCCERWQTTKDGRSQVTFVSFLPCA